VTDLDRESVSALLVDLAAGRNERAHELLPLVYRELRRLAEARLRKLPPGQTLQPTALVHEAYLALVDGGDPGWAGRAHFFGAAARAMRDILVDDLRRKGAAKRNGGQRAVSLDEEQVARALGVPADDLLAVSQALERLGQEHPRQAEVAMLRGFAGLSEAEIAELFEVTTRTVERDWRFAKAFLARELTR
jgi:RNA polymerase sigma factor (TIGR02999 family)